MNATSEGESFPGSVQIPGGTTVLVELTPDIHICGICKQQFNNLDAFVAHKQSGCPLTGSSGAAPSTVQFVSEETVPAAQTQATTRTITSETQTITVSAPEFVFEHGYQTYLPTESNENQTATVISLPAKSRAKKPTAPPAQKRLNCCYPGCQFKTAYGMKDMERHLKIHTGDAPFQCWLCSAKFKISSDLKRHMRVHSGEKPFKCEFCNVRCTMKGNLKSHIRIKHSGNNFKCPHCDFLGDSKATLRKHSRAHQSEHPEKCSECSYSCPSKAALRVHERIHCTDRPFKCQYCSFDSKQPSNLSKHVKKFHADVVKTEALERKDSGRQSSRQVAKLDAKKTFHCDMCEASFMREDSLRSHKRQHSEYHENKNSDVTVLQFQIDPSKQPAAPLTVGHLQVPLQPSQVPPFSEGRVKIIVGHQVPQANTIIQAAAAAVNIVPPALVAQNPEELPGNSRLQILRQVNLIAPSQPSGCPSEAGAMTQPAVLLTAHDQADGATLHQTLIPATPGSPQEGSGNQTFITSSGITCTDFEGLNALIQEGTTEVTVVSDGGQNIAVATTAPPIFSSSSQQELPKQTYSIIQGGAHPALLCPADSIPD
ncbi:zinc finger protein 64 isoform X5 [Prionailurus bengalensis]|uniref:zinc finger protein 64 isoform X5 n=1 Tax=Prionailurus bengalensis TaxID=37029 RepID=UPI001CA96A27|nr:zinc finger protein 64 isoform X5 [Prionailurus bengalensis]